MANGMDMEIRGAVDRCSYSSGTGRRGEQEQFLHEWMSG
jgi:hypothetical protein